MHQFVLAFLAPKKKRKKKKQLMDFLIFLVLRFPPILPAQFLLKKFRYFSSLPPPYSSLHMEHSQVPPFTVKAANSISLFTGTKLGKRMSDGGGKQYGGVCQDHLFYLLWRSQTHRRRPPIHLHLRPCLSRTLVRYSHNPNTFSSPYIIFPFHS